MINLDLCPYYRKYYEYIIADEMMRINSINKRNSRMSENTTYTVAELAKFDGTGGKPAYVAVNGIVYDISREATWGGATHFGLEAGKDLTAQFNSCHGQMQTLAKLPKVGVLV
jgi:predicted heme/steroid binding protein